MSPQVAAPSPDNAGRGEEGGRHGVIAGLTSLPFRIAFVLAGSAVFIGLLWLGVADDYSIKIIVALGAAWIASGIPGFLELQSRRVRAGGAIAVFVFVMLADDAGRWIGGRTAVPGTPATVPLSKKQLRFQAEIASAQFEFVQKNYRTAIEILKNAGRTSPKDPLMLHMLGSAYFQMRNYSNAAEVFEAGFKNGGPEAGRFAYNAALSYDAMHQPQNAKEWIEEARKSQGPSKADYPALWADTLILRGLLYMVEGMDAGAPLSRSAFEGAVGSFHEFLDGAGIPLVWAHYNLACLHATPAAHAPVQQIVAVDYFIKFITGLKSMPDPEQRKESVALAQRIVLGKRKPEDLRGPAESWECPAIKTIWTKSARKWEEVEKELSSPETFAPPPPPETQPPVGSVARNP